VHATTTCRLLPAQLFNTFCRHLCHPCCLICDYLPVLPSQSCDSLCALLTGQNFGRKAKGPWHAQNARRRPPLFARRAQCRAASHPKTRCAPGTTHRKTHLSALDRGKERRLVVFITGQKKRAFACQEALW
jgi:hypothetical protein